MFLNYGHSLHFMSNRVKFFLLSYKIPHIFASSEGAGQMLLTSAYTACQPVADPEGVQGICLSPPFDTKSFHLH